MGVLIENADKVLSGFLNTLGLFAVSGLSALVIGTLVAAMRVSPIPVLRGVGTFYVGFFRNTPLLVLLILTVFGLPELGVNPSFFVKSCLAMSFYTAAFVCEALRSGVNSIAMGQAEAARSVGMRFGTTMTQIVLPQALRAVVPPMASVLIALVKNTSLASSFGILEATARMKGLINDDPGALWFIFLGIALGYVVIVELISLLSASLERRWRVAR